MGYGEARQVLERANEKFEFPVKWGIDLPSEHERYLTPSDRKRGGAVELFPSATQVRLTNPN